MLQESFIFLERIGLQRERRIWQSGIADWDAFLGSRTIGKFSPMSKGFYDRQLTKAKQALRDDDASFFYS